MHHRHAMRLVILAAALGVLIAGRVSATTVIPIADQELYDRADVIVHGVVVSSGVEEDAAGRPVTVSVIEPLEIVKGQLAGRLVLRQLGGELPDGRFLRIWGRPEYEAGYEVLVFAIERADGDYQTAELLLGKFDIQIDDTGTSFAVPALAPKAPGVHVVSAGSSALSGDGEPGTSEMTAPRELSGFLSFLRGPGPSGFTTSVSPRGELGAVVRFEYLGPRPLFSNIGGSLWRWNNGATAIWTLDGRANVTGGGTAEAANAAATWNDEPNATINYSVGAGTSNFVHLNALSSPCGWSTCLSGGGVIGCGGPGGGGLNLWRGENYATISYGEVWLRSACTFDGYDSILTQAVLTHELGHTLGLGHSDQDVSAHDLCRGDEGLAQMRSVVQHRTTLGTDDSDAVRWLYGDGGNSCSGPSLTVTKAGSGSGTVTSTPAGILCGSTCSAFFPDGVVVALSAVPDANSVFAGWSGDPECANGAVTMNASHACTATFDPLPDLVVVTLSVPSTAAPGTSISISETTKNSGGAVGPSTTRYYLSTDSTWDLADIPLGVRPVPELGVGGTSPGTVSLAIPAGTATGTRYIIARADADGRWVESNENNNTKAASIRISPPDLVVSALSVPPSSGAGQTISVDATTRNQSGAGPAPASTTRFYLSRDVVLGAGDTEIGSRPVGALPPGGASAGTSNVTIPAGTPPGTWYIVAKADADDAVPEISETNNTRSDTVVIGPDLLVLALSTPATGGAGLPITVIDTVKNQGGGSTVVSSTMSFYLSTNATLDSGDVLLTSRTVGVLGPNATSRGTTTMTIPAGTAPGNYYVIASADDGAAVLEVNESNNTKAALIKLSPDLVVSGLALNVTTVAAGGTVSVTETTRNQGAGSAAQTTTRYYLSTNTTLDGSDVPLGSRDIDILMSGASSAGQTSVRIPVGTPTGKYYIVGRADADNRVSESNEGNNTANRAITITP